jgi:hypothetical protein
MATDTQEGTVEKVTAECISPERIDDTGGDDLMRLFALGGLPAIAGIVTAMAIGMHFLPGY